MSEPVVERGVVQGRRLVPPRWVWIACTVGVVVGLGGLAVGFVGPSPVDAWLWLVIWFLLFGGFAYGILLWSAAFRVAQVRWTPVVSRLGHAGIAFVPVALLILIVLLAGIRAYVPWTAHTVPEKEAWLNVPFMALRQLVLVGLLSALCYLMVRWSLTADAKTREGGGLAQRDHYRLNAVSVAIVITYAITFSVVAYDFVMSLSPEWFSTMFAPYIWVTNMYAGLAVLILLGAALRGPLAVVKYLEPDQFRDLGNLMLGFSLFSMGLFFAQYLTIWYGNVPEETFFLIERYLKGPWPPLGWTAFVLGYAIPFLLLQSRALKQRPRLLSIVAVLALIGIALERYVLVVPSVKPDDLALSPVSALSGLAFFGAFILSIVVFLMFYQPVSSAQEALREMDSAEEGAI
ncbi:MAG: hypothetical protein HYX78_02900 [Armatimonadetes bacterium]|nr:hypothetical protein [Armatimonadota bacterium]